MGSQEPGGTRAALNDGESLNFSWPLCWKQQIIRSVLVQGGMSAMGRSRRPLPSKPGTSRIVSYPRLLQHWAQRMDILNMIVCARKQKTFLRRQSTREGHGTSCPSCLAGGGGGRGSLYVCSPLTHHPLFQSPANAWPCLLASVAQLPVAQPRFLCVHSRHLQAKQQPKDGLGLWPARENNGARQA